MGKFDPMGDPMGGAPMGGDPAGGAPMGSNPTFDGAMAAMDGAQAANMAEAWMQPTRPLRPMNEKLMPSQVATT